jgi:hypothetical protein
MLKRLALFTFSIAATAALAIAAPPPSGGGMPPLPPQPKVRPAGLPADVLLLTPCVATMGEHWANPKNLPFGPIYGTYKGQVVFTEVMIDKKDFERGKGWSNVLKPLPGHKIDHVDIWYEPTGHIGYPIPHYDLHAFYVPESVNRAFCPGGIKVPDTITGAVMK